MARKRRGFPVGALDVHGEFVNCLFAKDLIQQTPIVQDVQDKIGLAVPFLVARMDQGDLDMVKIFPYLQQKEKWMALGFSLSSMLKEAAALVSKPILVLGDHVAIGWKPDGTMFNPEQEDFPLHQIEEEIGRASCRERV